MRVPLGVVSNERGRVPPVVAIVIVITALVAAVLAASTGVSERLVMFVVGMIIFGSVAAGIYRGGASPGQQRTRRSGLDRELANLGRVGYVLIAVGAALAMTSAWSLGELLFFIGLIVGAIGHARRASA